MAFTLTSPVFADGTVIPAKYTCDGSDGPPPLQVSNPPQGTKSFALIVDDPDAPTGTFTHWLAYDIPPDTADLKPTAGKMLRNDFGRYGYSGPCPPAGDASHRYHFTVYALDVASLDVSGDTRDDLEAAIKGHELAKARMMGRYARAEAARTG